MIHLTEIIQILFMGLSAVAFILIGISLLSSCDYEVAFVNYTIQCIALGTLGAMLIDLKFQLTGDINEC